MFYNKSRVEAGNKALRYHHNHRIMDTEEDRGLSVSMIKLENILQKALVQMLLRKNRCHFGVFTLKCYCKNPICPASKTLLYLLVRKVTFGDGKGRKRTKMDSTMVCF